MLQGFQNIILAIKDWANGKFQPSGNYALVDNAGYSLGLNIDSDYIMTIELKNASGNVLSTKSIDFPIESMVVNASYADGELTLTLQNGQTITVDISSIVNGLVNDTFTIAGINMKDDITKEELASALGVPTKISDLENDSNFLTKTGDVSNTTVTFEKAVQRANVQSGDSLEVAFAKLSKYCADLNAVAFSGAYGDLTGVPQSLKNPNALTFTGAVTGSYDGSAEESVAIPSITNNLLSTEAGTALDAVQGKALDEKITKINSDLPKFKDIIVNLSIVEWIESSKGMYYAYFDTGLTSGSIPISCNLSAWGNIRKTDIIQPYVVKNNNDKCGIMSNVNSFLYDSLVTVRIVYI